MVSKALVSICPHVELILELTVDTMGAYANSKLANALYAKELAKRLAPEGILVVSLHPGGM